VTVSLKVRPSRWPRSVDSLWLIYLGSSLTQDLFTAKEREQDWFPLARAKTGRIRLSAEWKALNLPGSVNGAGAYTAPIGILRILLKKAVDVKSVLPVPLLTRDRAADLRFAARATGTSRVR
jgi:hypothetical protein